MQYNRVLLKLSGEALASDGQVFCIDKVKEVAMQIKELVGAGVEVGVVVGGGNLWRGATAEKAGMDRTAADYIGMMGTIMNAMVLEQVLENICDVRTRTMTSIEIPKIAEPYIRKRALRHFEKGRVIIFGGGTGSPYFTTDTTAALRAAEIHAQAILMAKNGVDGVYDSDPKQNPNAVKFDTLTYKDLLVKDLKVMDSTAAAMCADNNIDLVIFDMNKPGNIVKAAKKEAACTTVSAK